MAWDVWAVLCHLVVRYSNKSSWNQPFIPRFSHHLEILFVIVMIFAGIILTLSGNQTGVEYLLMGRSIGMIQSMRFSIWFREVLQRSFYVLPFLAGPVILILTTMHIFVCIGMTLWKGSVVAEDQADNEDIEYLYYLNNFNSYREGCITVFNVLVVNDWTEIAK